MADDDLDLASVKRMAVEIGMTRLTDAHLQQLLTATRAARARRGALRVETLTYADEPAHLPRLPAGDRR